MHIFFNIQQYIYSVYIYIYIYIYTVCIYTYIYTVYIRIYILCVCVCVYIYIYIVYNIYCNENQICPIFLHESFIETLTFFTLTQVYIKQIFINTYITLHTIFHENMHDGIYEKSLNWKKYSIRCLVSHFGNIVGWKRCDFNLNGLSRVSNFFL